MRVCCYNDFIEGVCKSELREVWFTERTVEIMQIGCREL